MFLLQESQTSNCHCILILTNVSGTRKVHSQEYFKRNNQFVYSIDYKKVRICRIYQRLLEMQWQPLFNGK